MASNGSNIPPRRAPRRAIGGRVPAIRAPSGAQARRKYPMLSALRPRTRGRICLGNGAMVAVAAAAGLRDKLRKIERCSPASPPLVKGRAADAAADRIAHAGAKPPSSEAAEEMRFSIRDNWSRQLFIALCRRYGISPFATAGCTAEGNRERAPKLRRRDLWPEFRELSAALSIYLPKLRKADTRRGSR